MLKSSLAKAVVRQIYRSLLGREPDAGGARIFEELINKLGVANALPQLLDALLNSDEYWRLQATRGPRIQLPENSYVGQYINGHPVSHIASLGTHCLTSSVLKNNGLKRYSLPFDWGFSSPAMITDCLTDDFAGYLNRRHYRSLTHEQGERAADHLLYRDRYGVNAIFTHRDPTRPEDYQYTERCVQRFRRLLTSDDAKIFLICSKRDHDLPEQFPTLVERLGQVTTNFVVLGIRITQHTGESGVSSLTPMFRLSQHAMYEFSPSSDESPFGYFPDKLDEMPVLRLLHQYRLSIKDNV